MYVNRVRIWNAVKMLVLYNYEQYLKTDTKLNGAQAAPPTLHIPLI